MCKAFSLLLLCSLVLSPYMSAQINWSKRVYHVTGSRVLRADFAGDGYADLFVYGGNTSAVLPNTGNGTFDTTKVHTLNMALSDAVALDFNRDGKTDIAGCNHNTLIILQGNGDGSLSVSHTTQIACQWVTSGDFNHDGNPDIAVGVVGEPLQNINKVVVLLGDGHGGIASQVENLDVNFNSSEGNACSIDGHAVASDFTGDKLDDLFITADCSDGVQSFSAIIFGKGDGTGHFAFHRDRETLFNADMKLHLSELNQDGKSDVVAVGHGTGPDNTGASALDVFISHGDGTFGLSEIVAGAEGFHPIIGNADVGDHPDVIVRAGAFADFNGDGIKDGLVMLDTFNVEGVETLSLQLFAGQIYGQYLFAGKTSLASQVSDMYWGDFDKDGLADVVLVRPNSTDVWLNRSAGARCSPKPTVLRSLTLCPLNSGLPDTFLFLASPLDNRQVNALQLYIDGILTLQTPDDLFGINLALPPGQHRITAKGWDNLGPFSATKTINSASTCGNSTNRTMKICSPLNGATITGSGGIATVRINATAATNLKYNVTQVFVDGFLLTNTPSKSVDILQTFGTGTHPITVKGWDSGGQFSSSINITVK
ncbi:MAG TPA: VCBS repeat-containing protein [Terriglobales bacterium]